MQYRGYEIVGVSWESTIWTLDENNEPDDLIWENPSEGITQFQVCVQVSTEPPRYEATDEFEYELFDTIEQAKERINEQLGDESITITYFDSVNPATRQVLESRTGDFPVGTFNEAKNGEQIKELEMSFPREAESGTLVHEDTGEVHEFTV